MLRDPAAVLLQQQGVHTPGGLHLPHGALRAPQEVPGCPAALRRGREAERTLPPAQVRPAKDHPMTPPRLLPLSSSLCCFVATTDIAVRWLAGTHFMVELCHENSNDRFSCTSGILNIGGYFVKFAKTIYLLYGCGGAPSQPLPRHTIECP